MSGVRRGLRVRFQFSMLCCIFFVVPIKGNSKQKILSARGSPRRAIGSCHPSYGRRWAVTMWEKTPGCTQESRLAFNVKLRALWAADTRQGASTQGAGVKGLGGADNSLTWWRGVRAGTLAEGRMKKDSDKSVQLVTVKVNRGDGEKKWGIGNNW